MTIGDKTTETGTPPPPRTGDPLDPATIRYLIVPEIKTLKIDVLNNTMIDTTKMLF